MILQLEALLLANAGNKAKILTLLQAPYCSIQTQTSRFQAVNAGGNSSGRGFLQDLTRKYFVHAFKLELAPIFAKRHT